MRICDGGAVNLAVGIVLQAAEDYVRCIKAMKRKPRKDDHKSYHYQVISHPEDELTALRRFFRSDWFNLLCDLDGEAVMAWLDAHPVKPSHRDYARAVDAAARRPAYDWNCVEQWPELRARLIRAGISPGTLAGAMGITTSGMFGVIAYGSDRTRERLEAAAEAVIARAEKGKTP